jgi:hypothetical protein
MTPSALPSPSAARASHSPGALAARSACSQRSPSSWQAASPRPRFDAWKRRSASSSRSASSAALLASSE